MPQYSKELLQLIEPVVDVQPVYTLTHVALADETSIYPPETRAYVRMKLREASKAMRAAARHIDKKLAEFEETAREGER